MRKKGGIMKSYQQICQELLVLLEDIETSLDEIETAEAVAPSSPIQNLTAQEEWDN